MISFMGFWQRYKTILVFLIEWSAFLLLEACLGQLSKPYALGAGLLALCFFLLAGIFFSKLAQRFHAKLNLLQLIPISIGLTGLDQICKLLINANIPEEGRIPVLPPWIALGHERNYANSWLLDSLEIENFNKAWLILFTLVILALIGFFYDFYVWQQRGGFWPAAAFVLISGGVFSALVDQTIWNFTLDFINLTHLVTADLKDIDLTLGIGCLLAEATSNPRVHWRIDPRQDLRDLRAYFESHKHTHQK
jgi:lipoprotein signal peptidase